jgi:hypothetical protein
MAGNPPGWTKLRFDSMFALCSITTSASPTPRDRFRIIKMPAPKLQHLPAWWHPSLTRW